MTISGYPGFYSISDLNAGQILNALLTNIKYIDLNDLKLPIFDQRHRRNATAAVQPTEFSGAAKIAASPGGSPMLGVDLVADNAADGCAANGARGAAAGQDRAGSAADDRTGGGIPVAIRHATASRQGQGQNGGSDGSH
jgi:hypothetical protein